MDEKDRLLLIYLQSGLSLNPRPFDVLSAKIGLDSAELLVRIQRLKKEGVFAGIKAILNPRAFHYRSAWVAVRTGGRSCAEIFGRHPGVFYVCEREHEFDLWYFIAVPAGHDLELHVKCLERLAGIPRTLCLPVRKMVKGTELLNSWDAGTFPPRDEKASDAPSAEEVELIRQIQEPFPLTDEPYRKIAQDLGISEDQALERVKMLAKKGYLKRIGTFLRSEPFSSGAKSLLVWQVPEEKLERLGSVMAGFPEVLYADARPVFTEFPYSLYMMVQANTPSELEVLARRVQDRIGKWPYQALRTTQELVKKPVKYFPQELERWWRENRHVAETAFH